MNKEPKLNSVRIVKVDRYNYAVQKYRKFHDKRFKDSEPRLGWDEVGYYGSNLHWAAKSALMQAVPENSDLLGEFEKAVLDIVENTAEHFGVKKPSTMQKEAELKQIQPELPPEPVKRKRGRPPKKKD